MTINPTSNTNTMRILDQNNPATLCFHRDDRILFDRWDDQPP
jgi:hypothetical protein